MALLQPLVMELVEQARSRQHMRHTQLQHTSEEHHQQPMAVVWATMQRPCNCAEAAKAWRDLLAPVEESHCST
jgi:hypothetical protein